MKHEKVLRFATNRHQIFGYLDGDKFFFISPVILPLIICAMSVRVQLYGDSDAMRCRRDHACRRRISHKIYPSVTIANEPWPSMVLKHS
jgi:hypothetical protein